MLTKVSRETLAEQVTRELATYIKVKDLKPGDPLPSETQLATSFGVSRPVIREGLKSLEGRGIIEIINGKGAIVLPVSSKPLLTFFHRASQTEYETIVELMEVRKGLEIQSATLAAQRRTPQELEQLKHTVNAMREHLHEPKIFVELDVEFHMLLAFATHNVMLRLLVESIRESLRDTIREGLSRRRTPEQFEQFQETHEALFAMVENKNPGGAGQVMALHFDEAIMAIIQAEEKVGGQDNDA